MVSRIYVEKKPGFDVEAQQLAHELRSILGISLARRRLRLVNRYDVEGIDAGAVRSACVPTVFSEPQVDVAYDRAARGRRRRRCSPWSSCPASSTSAPTRQASASS